MLVPVCRLRTPKFSLINRLERKNCWGECPTTRKKLRGALPGGGVETAVRCTSPHSSLLARSTSSMSLATHSVNQFTSRAKHIFNVACDALRKQVYIPREAHLTMQLAAQSKHKIDLSPQGQVYLSDLVDLRPRQDEDYSKLSASQAT